MPIDQKGPIPKPLRLFNLSHRACITKEGRKRTDLTFSRVTLTKGIVTSLEREA